MVLIISANTTWTTGQTINLSDDVQIAPGATLTIQAGATVNGNGHSLAAFGALAVAGTAGQPAILNALDVKFGNDFNHAGRIDIDHATVTNSALFPVTGNAQYGAFSVTNSLIQNSSRPLYIYYPTSDSIISGNVFLNSGGISVLADRGATLHITDNAFIHPSSGISGSATIVDLAAYGNPVEVARNSFFYTSHAALEVALGYTGTKIDASDNYFGTADTGVIAGLILDRNDDLNRSSVINFQPFSNAPSPRVLDALESAGFSVIAGTFESDKLADTAANDIIYSDNGDDVIIDRNGSDTIISGSGNDRIDIIRTDITNGDSLQIDAGLGDDVIYLNDYSSGFARIDFGPGDDRLILAGVAQPTFFGTGTLISLGTGVDTVTLGSAFGAQSQATLADFAAGTGGDRLDLVPWLASTLRGWNGSDNPFGSAGFLRLVQSGSGTLLQIDKDGVAGVGSDWTTVLNLQNVTTSLTAENVLGLDPSGSNPVGINISGTSSDDVLTGTGGPDTIFGLSGNDIIDAGIGADIIHGSSGNDSIKAGPGIDFIDGGTGNDTIDGGAGVDSAYYMAARNELVVTRNSDGTLKFASAADGSDTVSGVELFQFSDGLYSFRYDDPGDTVVNNFTVNAGGWTSQDKYARHVADVNGDGFADIVGFGQAGTLVSYGSANGKFSGAGTAVANFGQNQGWTSDNTFHRELVDVNHDGKADIVGFGIAGVLVSIAQAGGTFAAPVLGSSNFNPANGWSSEDAFARTLADVNGDGFADVVGFGIAGTYVALGKGTGTFGPTNFALANFGANQGWTSDNTFHRTVADVNGDGRADIIGFGIAGTLVSLGKADGTFAAPSLAVFNFGTDQGWSSQDTFTRAVGDVNGDGMADVVGFGIAGTFVSYGQADGTLSAAGFDVSNFGKNQGWTSDNVLHRELADVNHDGLADIVGFGFNGVFVSDAFMI